MTYDLQEERKEFERAGVFNQRSGGQLESYQIESLTVGTEDEFRAKAVAGDWDAQDIEDFVEVFKFAWSKGN